MGINYYIFCTPNTSSFLVTKEFVIEKYLHGYESLLLLDDPFIGLKPSWAIFIVPSLAIRIKEIILPPYWKEHEVLLMCIYYGVGVKI